MKETLTKILTVIKAFFIVLITVFFSILSLLAILIRSNKTYFFLSKTWSYLLLLVSGVKVKIIGKEYIQKKQNYIFISNHASHFDIPILQVALSGMVALVYKDELEKIPIFGYALGLSPNISINRSHPKKAIESINNAIVKLNKGISVVIFPEGTRTPDGAVKEFKRGAFMLASRSGKPIIPISISGSYRLLPKGRFNIKGGKVNIIIHKPIENYKIKKPEDEKNLMQNIHEIIKNDAKN